MSGTEHGGVVVRIACGNHSVVQRPERFYRQALLIGLAELVVGDRSGRIHNQTVTHNCWPIELPHQRLGELLEGVGKDDDLCANSQFVEKRFCSR